MYTGMWRLPTAFKGYVLPLPLSLGGPSLQMMGLSMLFDFKYMHGHINVFPSFNGAVTNTRTQKYVGTFLLLIVEEKFQHTSLFVLSFAYSSTISKAHN